MSSTIPVVGLSASDPLPGVYPEVNFAQGDPVGGSASYEMLLVGAMSPSGSASVSTVYGPATATPAANESQVVTLFGRGSDLHRMFLRVAAVSPQVPVNYLVVSESSGARATGTVTLTTTATAAATLRIHCGDEHIDTGIVSGDSVTTQANAATLNVNSKINWPIIAQNSAGVITLTAKQKGTLGNKIRYWAQILDGRPTTTVTPTAVTAFTGGTTDIDLTAALATIVSKRFYYIAVAADDSTNLALVSSQVNTAGQANNNLRQRFFWGQTGTLASAITSAQAVNNPRGECIWSETSDLTPGELAANNAAVYALEEKPRAIRVGHDGYGNSAKTAVNWKLKAPKAVTKGETATATFSQLNSALNSGLTPLGVNTNGSSYIVMRITSRSLNGTLVDTRIRDAHKVTVCDRFTDDLVSKVALTMDGKKVADNQPRGDKHPGRDFVTPNDLKSTINKMVRDYGPGNGLGLVENPGEIIAQTEVIREAAPRTRLSAAIPLQTVDALHQVALSVNQVA